MLFLSHLQCLMLFASRIKHLNALIPCCYITSRATLRESLMILKLKSSLNVAKEPMLLYLFDNDFQMQLGFYNLIHDNKRFNDIIY